jgi:hypothetical protein
MEKPYYSNPEMYSCCILDHGFNTPIHVSRKAIFETSKIHNLFILYYPNTTYFIALESGLTQAQTWTFGYECKPEH